MISAASLRPVTASQSGAVNRSRMAVLVRKRTTWLGLATDDLLKEIVGDVPVAVGELADELTWVVLAPEGQCRQVQSGRPPLRSVDQFRQVTLA